MGVTSLTQPYRILPSWQYRDGSYRGQLGLYWGTGFVRQEWLCLHRYHRTREAATACAYVAILDVLDRPAVRFE